jgi:hypothetical protein
MRTGRRTSWTLVGAGLLVGVIGMHGLALQVMGRTTAAVVTQALHMVGRGADSADSGYLIRYRFEVQGTDYFGRASCRRVDESVALPAVGSLIEVRYLPVAPSVNESTAVSPVRGGLVGLSSVLLIGLSLSLLFRRTAE